MLSVLKCMHSLDSLFAAKAYIFVSAVGLVYILRLITPLAFSSTEAGFELFSTYRPNWKLDGSNRSPVQSLEITGSYCEDEDMETYLSDADREAETESSSQSNEKQGESFNTNAIYAVPCKNKKVVFLIS